MLIIATDMDHHVLVNTSTRALEIATSIAAKARPRKNIISLPLPTIDPESKPYLETFETTAFIHAFNDPDEISEIVESGDVLYVCETDQMRQKDDDSALPVLCHGKTDGSRPFGVVSSAELVMVRGNTSYVGVVCQGPCLVLLSLLFGKTATDVPSTVAAEKVWIGAPRSMGGIEATLIVCDAPHSLVCVK